METNSPADTLLTPRVAAELIGLSVWTLAYWRRSTVNRGPAFVHRGGYRKIAYRLADVLGFIESRTGARTN